MSFLLRSFVVVFLLVATLAVGWDRYTAFFLSDTSAEVRWTGFGQTPDVCSARLAEHFEPMREDLTELATIILEEPTLLGASAGFRLGRVTEIQLTTLEDDTNGNGYPEVNLFAGLEDVDVALAKRIESTLSGIVEHQTPFRPTYFEIEESGRVAGRVLRYGRCGWSVFKWMKTSAGVPNNGRGGPRYVGELQIEFRAPPDDLPLCSSEPPVAAGEIWGYCVVPLGGDWRLRQYWADKCEAFRKIGSAGPDDSEPSFCRE
ncbi:MAG: hypothetical protein HRU11_15440 [Parvularculaceae bacterium]|nr:hypothetical protein [Parvularculaceae bacterium]